MSGASVADEWYPFSPAEDPRGSVLDVSSWMDAPAGKHGFLRCEGDGFAFEDGTPVRFWGTNICNARVACDNETARRWADFLAFHGVNGVRFHKFTWAGEREGLGSPDDSPQFVPDMLDRMDYFVARLRERGIYLGWSHIYGHRVQPGDRPKLLAYDEVKNAGEAHLKGSTIGLVHFAPDLQDLSIRMTANLLDHRNPYTGLRYADDPALAYVELQNEDDIFFPTTRDFVKACPTYRRLFCEQFSSWLAKRYPSHEALVAAWGEASLNAFREDHPEDEHLARRSIYPMAHAWYMDPPALGRCSPGMRRRMLDTARFLYETQCAFYARFAQAIRETGYRGALVGSCWQAASGVPHYYNLHSDCLVGHVDRHNYFGGSGGHVLRAGPVSTRAMLDQPGSGLLSTGMQQVLGRPFALSEWMSLIPNEWVAEAPAIIGVYGMGLQGWDASFSFACDGPAYTPTVQSRTIYNASSPTHMGLYPAVARMVYRGDVQEGAVVSVRKVCIAGLADGTPDFADYMEQDGDVKSFGGIVPPEALAVGRVLVEFTDKPEATREPDLTRWWDWARKLVRSTTGQLTWDYAGRGFFTVDTPGRRAVVGFAGGRRFGLADVTIELETPFACVFVTSLDRAKPIAESDSLLVTAVGRARNTGMDYSEDGAQVTALGGPPLLLETIRATIAVRGRGRPTVNVLDHSGRRTDAVLPVSVRGRDATFAIGKGCPGTLYYEVAYR